MITANQQEAVIQQGQEIGYVTFQNSGGTGQGTATVQFKDAVLELRVTPTITADDRVFMKLKVTKDAINSFVPNPGGGFDAAVGQARDQHLGAWSTTARRWCWAASTSSTRASTSTKVPFLGDIPVLGALFRHKTNRTTRRDC